MVEAEDMLSDCAVPVLPSDIDEENADVTGMLVARGVNGVSPVLVRVAGILGMVAWEMVTSGAIPVLWTLGEEGMTLAWVADILEAVWVEAMSVTVADGTVLPSDEMGRRVAVMVGMPALCEGGVMDVVVSCLPEVVRDEEVAVVDVAPVG
jgi:hypothetical protein